MTINAFEVELRAWNITFNARIHSFHSKNLQHQKEETNEQNPYTVAIVKRTAGCTENQGSWAWADR